MYGPLSIRAPISYYLAFLSRPTCEKLMGQTRWLVVESKFTVLQCPVLKATQSGQKHHFYFVALMSIIFQHVHGPDLRKFFLAPAVTVGETEGAMDSTSVFFLPVLLPITL